MAHRWCKYGRCSGRHPGGWTGADNIEADPLFVNPAADDYRLCGTAIAPSPCKNAGNNDYVPTDLWDLDWETDTSEKIPFHLTGTVNRLRTTTVDMGAYEWIKVTSSQ